MANLQQVLDAFQAAHDEAVSKGIDPASLQVLGIDGGYACTVGANVELLSIDELEGNLPDYANTEEGERPAHGLYAWLSVDF